uniref:Uncharacterized protein n=1 Tax=Scylla olivacea TaxID=85551 RepID=A0A0P4WQU1_SCYOL
MLTSPLPSDSPAVFRMRAVGGGLLPNPRHVSLLMSLAPEGAKVEGNSLFVQMGQFIDHDFSITTTVREMTPGGECCVVMLPVAINYFEPSNRFCSLLLTISNRLIAYIHY